MFEKNSYERTLLITFSVVFLSLLGLYIIYPNEPEFINSYCILTSESSLEVLPK